jgi:hypothetical protein
MNFKPTKIKTATSLIIGIFSFIVIAKTLCVQYCAPTTEIIKTLYYIKDWDWPFETISAWIIVMISAVVTYVIWILIQKKRIVAPSKTIY